MPTFFFSHIFFLTSTIRYCSLSHSSWWWYSVCGMLGLQSVGCWNSCSWCQVGWLYRCVWCRNCATRWNYVCVVFLNTCVILFFLNMCWKKLFFFYLWIWKMINFFKGYFFLAVFICDRCFWQPNRRSDKYYFCISPGYQWAEVSWPY